MKILLALTMSLIAMTSQAQNSGIKQLSQESNQLVQQHIHLLPQQDRERVRGAIQAVVQTFAENGIYIGNPQPTPRNIVCNSTNNVLVDLDRNGFLIYDFNSIENCMEAKDFVLAREPFCDYGNNSLHHEERGMIHDFASAENCREGRARVAVGKNYCDYNNNALYSSTGQLIYDFSSAEDCRRAMN